MLSTLLKKKKISLYSLSKETGIPYTTLSDIKNNKVMIDHISIGTIRKIASACSMTLDEIYDELTRPDSFIKTQSDYPVSKRLYNKIVKLRIPIPVHNTEGRFVLEEDKWKLLFNYNEQSIYLPFDGIVSNERYAILEALGAFQIENYLKDYIFQHTAESVMPDEYYRGRPSGTNRGKCSEHQLLHPGS